jgi:hypothetical protein
MTLMEKKFDYYERLQVNPSRQSWWIDMTRRSTIRINLDFGLEPFSYFGQNWSKLH